MAKSILLHYERGAQLRRLLIHTCSYSEPAGRDRDGNETYSAAVTLERVRLTPVLSTAKTIEGETKDDKLTLYYSPTISTGNITLKELARIIWNDNGYTIRSVTPCYTKDGAAVHHYEAALV